MGLSKTQAIIVALVTIFAILLALSLLFAFYSSRKARREDEEARLAVLGRWREIGQVVVKGVPHPPRSSSKFKFTGTKEQKAEVDQTIGPRVGGLLPPRSASLGRTSPVLESPPERSASRPVNGRRYSGLAGIGIPGFLPDPKAVSLQAERERGLTPFTSSAGTGAGAGAAKQLDSPSSKTQTLDDSFLEKRGRDDESFTRRNLEMNDRLQRQHEHRPRRVGRSGSGSGSGARSGSKGGERSDRSERERARSRGGDKDRRKGKEGRGQERERTVHNDQRDRDRDRDRRRRG